jgi:type II secretion system protein C
MVLKGLYSKNGKGFFIVALNPSHDKTTIVSVGDEFSGYTLKTILSNGIVFVKAGKEYTLNIKSGSTDSFIVPVKDDSDTKNVSHSDIEYYKKDPKNIWRDISIVEVKQADEIIGFEVTRVAEKSIMESIGLKKGDIIIKANNVGLKSYKDALDFYNKIDMLNTLDIIVMRNNQEKELIYEIN